jgi:hypothetical protein
MASSKALEGYNQKCKQKNFTEERRQNPEVKGKIKIKIGKEYMQVNKK